jgi:hypothetical protein
MGIAESFRDLHGKDATVSLASLLLIVLACAMVNQLRQTRAVDV